MSKLEDVINDLVAEKTFSLEILNKIQDLKTLSEELHEDLVLSEKNYDEYKEKYANSDRRLSELLKENGTLRSRESNLKERESTMQALEAENKLQQAVSATYRECYQFLLGNTIVREKIQKQIPVYEPKDPQTGCGGYHSSQSETTEKETSKGVESAGA